MGNDKHGGYSEKTKDSSSKGKELNLGAHAALSHRRRRRNMTLSGWCQESQSKTGFMEEEVVNRVKYRKGQVGSELGTYKSVLRNQCLLHHYSQ